MDYEEKARYLLDRGYVDPSITFDQLSEQIAKAEQKEKDGRAYRKEHSGDEQKPVGDKQDIKVISNKTASNNI